MRPHTQYTTNPVMIQPYLLTKQLRISTMHPVQAESQIEFNLFQQGGRPNSPRFIKSKKPKRAVKRFVKVQAPSIVEPPEAYMIDQSVWLRVPSLDNICFVSGLKGREILKLMPHNSKSYRMGVSMLVRFKHVSLGSQQSYTTCLVNRADLMRFIELGGVQSPPPTRFARYLRAYNYRPMDQVTDEDYIILAGPYGIGEEETLSLTLDNMRGKQGLELGYNRKSITIIQRRRS